MHMLLKLITAGSFKILFRLNTLSDRWCGTGKAIVTGWTLGREEKVFLGSRQKEKSSSIDGRVLL